MTPFFEGCSPSKCGRFITDDFADSVTIETLIKISDKAMSFGKATGGPSIFDLASGAVTYEKRFLSVYKKLDEPLLSKEEWDVVFKTYSRIEDKVRKVFGIENTLHLSLGTPSFFSKIDESDPITAHDEYDHAHVDRDQYGTFCYTGLLYLSTAEKDFSGGNFVWLKRTETGVSTMENELTLQPRVGRLSLFSSGSENPHRVTRVTAGIRRGIRMIVYSYI
ncbi:2-oxoglutarate and iron-dependent oxygenase domain-containing protein 3 [Phlyctochytrium planicorne]|nr:2-oxoglutarate and iron-dependent oxygenase domain-containing protein 3 [Phlyctochytrium planicorne]